MRQIIGAAISESSAQSSTFAGRAEPNWVFLVCSANLIEHRPPQQGRADGPSHPRGCRKLSQNGWGLRTNSNAALITQKRAPAIACWFTGARKLRTAQCRKVGRTVRLRQLRAAASCSGVTGLYCIRRDAHRYRPPDVWPPGANRISVMAITAIGREPI
jgi:hypothetical protein